MRNKFTVHGDRVEITMIYKDQEVSTFVDTIDLIILVQMDCNWVVSKKRSKMYAGALLNGKKTYMHRILTNAPKGMVVEHINHDTLDNTSKNLRVVTNAENMQNREGLNVNNSTGYRGVFFDKRDNVYYGQVELNRKTYSTSRCKNLLEAVSETETLRKQLHQFS